jgi:hypothetical protein
MTKDKVKLRKKDVPELEDYVKFEDLVSDQMSEGLKTTSMKKDFFKHLKFYCGSVLINDRFTNRFAVKGPCMNAIIRVLLDSFGNKHEHFVNTLDDNWIAKEFMS